MKIINSPYVWFCCFTAIFLLALDFWSWGQEPFFPFFHLPVWVGYFFGLQILLSIAIYLFSITFWTNAVKEKDAP